ncbi:hypothetical protein MLD38_013563 [Melastoma candidum]|uniref:Uncharacterized protein n=1 Tax=Melastoma candidum TaxID=119954 RepID=A0ACB9RBU5_9MYRT|nr:hypothetical protein MLD38_013563 [Melastoma candidum]
MKDQRSNCFSGSPSVNPFFFFVVAAAFAYVLIVYDCHPALVVTGVTKSEPSCDLFRGNWVRNESYPLYNASRCPFAEQGFNCLANGRNDTDYMKYQWKPEECDVPRFDPKEALEGLRGKRVVFVGDSLSRTQWESFICMLITGVDDQKSVYEINRNGITRQIRFLGVRFASFDLQVDFYRSVFLVMPGSRPRGAPKRVTWTLRLDEIDDINKKWIDSDVLVFNSGHWWCHEKLSRAGLYFNNSMQLGMPIPSAFRRGLETWASWVDANVNKTRTRVFFRTFESTHWSGVGGRSCEITLLPSKEMGGRDKSFVTDTVLDVLEKMKTRVIPLRVTPMGAYRSDGHAGRWSYEPAVPDCTHWCLPGVPEAWNEILFSFILSKTKTS